MPVNFSVFAVFLYRQSMAHFTDLPTAHTFLPRVSTAALQQAKKLTPTTAVIETKLIIWL